MGPPGGETQLLSPHLPLFILTLPLFRLSRPLGLWVRLCCAGGSLYLFSLSHSHSPFPLYYSLILSLSLALSLVSGWTIKAVGRCRGGY